MTRRTNIDAGPVLSIVGGLVLLVSLFLDWYEPGVSAWTVFEVIDLLLALSALAAILFSVALLWPSLVPPARLVAGERIVVVAGTVSLVLVASQLLNHPPAAQHEAVMYGAWLAFGGATLMFAGAVATLALVSLRVTFYPRRSAAAPPPPAGGESSETGETGETRKLG